MNRFFLFVVFFAVQIAAMAQNNVAATAKNYIRQGDYSNAILVLNRAVEQDGENIELKKDLAFAYFMARDYTRAIAVAKPLVESKDADAQSFQIMGMIYKAIEETKEAEKTYRTGIRKFPQSGALYNEYGEILWSKADYNDAVKQWHRGMEADPNHSGNYYNAAKFYYMSADKIWGLLYGEIFVNLESYSKRTPEIKTLLLEGYKKLFSESDLSKNQDTKNGFTKAFLDVMKNNSSVISTGVTPEALSALRTRFILEWFEKYAAKYPFKLFEYHQQLAREGMFDAYNQWIFGAAENLSAFQRWTATHAEAYNKFNQLQKNRVFKLPQGQDYRN